MMKPAWDTFVLATGDAAKLNDFVFHQAMHAIENFLEPKHLLLGEDTAVRVYGTKYIKRFQVEGRTIPVIIVEGEFVYLVGASIYER